MMPQRRAGPRVAATIAADYQQHGQTRGTCRVVELGAGGCLLGGTVLQPKGADVSLCLRFDPESPEACVQGAVVRVKEGSGTALEFVSASAEAQELIRQYIEHQLAEPV